LKKFKWRLERLLDIKKRQEEALRNELVRVTEEAVSVRRMIAELKALIRQKLGEIMSLSPNRRVAEQRFFMQYSHTLDAQIEEFNQKLQELEELRKQKLSELFEIRKFRKGLEKLREKAREEYMQEVKRFEQNELDERNSIRSARAVMSRLIKSDISGN
jgi:flagellar FliJ protein